MGYTHYITTAKKISDKEFDAIKSDIKKIEKKSKEEGVTLFDGRGENEGVVYEDDYIAFNGNNADGSSHETLYIDKNDVGFNFCKTARKPYDLAVCLALLSVKKHIPSAELASDGGAEEWELAVEVFGEMFEEIAIEFGEDGIVIKKLTT